MEEASSPPPEVGISLPNNDDNSQHSVRPGLGRRSGGRRLITGLAKNWVSPHSELAHVEQVHGKDSWQAKSLRVIHSHRFQTILMVALLLDVLILFVELYLLAAYPSCTEIKQDGVSCCPVEEGEHRWLVEEEHHSHGACQAPLVEYGPAGCDDHKHSAVHTAHLVLFIITLVILAAFFIELVVLLAVLGFRLFFHNRLYVLDLFIIVSSLSLEITFAALDEDDLATLSGLLIVGRIWRFVRIGHGLFATTMEVSLHKIEELESQVAILKQMVDESSGVHLESIKT